MSNFTVAADGTAKATITNAHVTMGMGANSIYTGGGTALMDGISLAENVSRTDDLEAGLNRWEERERPIVNGNICYACQVQPGQVMPVPREPLPTVKLALLADYVNGSGFFPEGPLRTHHSGGRRWKGDVRNVRRCIAGD